MKFVLKSRSDYYVQVVSSKRGDWGTVSDLSNATVFDLAMTEDGTLVPRPDLPFDTSDYRERERLVDFRPVAVAVVERASVTEV